MTRIEALLALYRLALQPPEQDHDAEFHRWLAERQALIERLQRASPAAHPAIERVLGAVIAHADGPTGDRLARWKGRVGALLQRARLGARSRGC